ncbi:hypothetical protein QA584_08590 [Anaerocolumna sp. AGMB13025]|uniref:hypothetical protein n=1 Tax=Anaerocolumna sp. AGMB13025 TaxID=3039116 RepID=UPI00241D5935|nr:hypothetical protein [Anaerocolumna sp. AGMB13025]WFR59129.1 hypothetical protein QA584_08590 [Anaerocolumna sp. AGMB13025]
MTYRKRVLLILVAVIMIIIVTVYYKPVKISSLVDNKGETSLQIVYLKGSETPVNMEMKFKNYNISSSSEDYKSIYNLLENYYCHLTIDTFTKDTFVGSFDDTIVIKGHKHEIQLTDTPKIIIDGTPYRVGYIGKGKSESLIREMLSILID